MSNAGQPRTLDEIKRREVCALFAAGCDIESVAKYLNCAPRTIHREMFRNRDFREAVSRAELSARLNPLKAMQQASGKHWRAAAWMLERMAPTSFLRRHPEMIDPNELHYILNFFFEIMREEIPDPKLRRRVGQQIRKGMVQLVRESITSRPSPKPRRRMRHGPPPPEPNWILRPDRPEPASEPIEPQSHGDGERSGRE